MNGRGSFAGCMVDSDAEALGRARRLRGKALAISLIFEAALVAAMLLWPLITPGVLPRQYVVTPTPPYGGHSMPNAGHNTSSPRANEDPVRPMPDASFHQPAIIPPHAQESLDAPSLDTSIGLGGTPGVPGGGEGPGNGGLPGGLGTNPPPSPPPAQPVPSPPLKVSEGVMEAALIQRVQPAYPRAAVTMHLSGTVELRAIIGTDGRVREAQVISGNAILARAALDAVNQWRYRPTLLSGKAVEVETLITVRFVLE
jgi:periplasmic protein TonB